MNNMRSNEIDKFFLSGLISQVINKQSKLLIIDNAIPGMGVVTNLLEQFKESTLVLNKDYIYTTADDKNTLSDLIELLKEEAPKDGIVIIDDSDEFLENAECINVFKSLTDSGICHVMSKSINETIEFTGSFILVARHLDRNKMIDSLISRGTDFTVEAD